MIMDLGRRRPGVTQGPHDQVGASSGCPWTVRWGARRSSLATSTGSSSGTSPNRGCSCADLRPCGCAQRVRRGDATTTSYNALLAAAAPGETDKPAKTTTIAYRDVPTQLWLLDPVPGWTPGLNHLTRLGQAPKHHLADPGLAVSLLGATPASLLDGTPLGPPVPRDGTLLGALFESLVTLSARVYAQASGASTFHLRTAGGEHEVDLILQRPDGRVVALEVKLSGTVEDRGVRHLHWLAGRLDDTLLDCAVVTSGPYAYRRPDGVAVIPAALLTA